MRSYRFVLALALGIVAMSASAEDPNLAATAADLTATTTGAATDGTAVGDGEILDAAASTVDKLNGDEPNPTLTGNNLEAASGVVQTVTSETASGALTDPVAAPAAGDLTQTAENVAANAGSVGTGGLADLASSSGSPGVRASVGVIDEMDVARARAHANPPTRC